MLKLPFLPARERRLPDLSAVEAVLFDLDGTLVEVDMNRFVPAYLNRLGRRLGRFASPHDTEQTLRASVGMMLTNTDGRLTLEERLLNVIQAELGIGADDYRQAIADFCAEDLGQLQPLVRAHPLARSLVEECLARGWRVVLATNPIFPRAVIDARLTWGGLDDLPFDPVTAYETSRYCKPQTAYFEEVLALLGRPAEACLMVGNDTEHDMAAGQVGMTTCLLTPWQIDRPGRAYSADWEGDHEALLTQLAAIGGRPRGNRDPD